MQPAQRHLALSLKRVWRGPGLIRAAAQEAHAHRCQLRGQAVNLLFGLDAAGARHKDWGSADANGHAADVDDLGLLVYQGMIRRRRRDRLDARNQQQVFTAQVRRVRFHLQQGRPSAVGGQAANPQAFFNQRPLELRNVGGW